MSAASADLRPDLRSLNLADTAALVQRLGLPPFRARQIFAWVHGKGVASVAAMTNLSKELRQTLAEQVTLAPLVLVAEQRAQDGTRKLALGCADQAVIETVLIPEEDKLTQCLSSQVGCALGCRFCATAQLGLARNLTTSEIVAQVYQARATLEPGQRISNLVLMGMGEPLNNLDQVLSAVEILCTDLGANFSPRRITVSTAGVVPGIEALGRRARQLGLAVSLNATTDEVRDQLMPVNRRWPLPVLLEALRRYPLPRRRRITIEYVLIAGVNDSLADARRLPQLLNGIRVKLNLIAYNPGRRDVPYRAPAPEAVEAFAETLRDKDLTVMVRRSRGQEIAAACGQLAGQGSVPTR